MKNANMESSCVHFQFEIIGTNTSTVRCFSKINVNGRIAEAPKLRRQNEKGEEMNDITTEGNGKVHEVKSGMLKKSSSSAGTRQEHQNRKKESK